MPIIGRGAVGTYLLIASLCLDPGASRCSGAELAAIRAAWKAASSLESGAGTGAFTESVHGSLVNSANVKTWFTRHKFRVELGYPPAGSRQHNGNDRHVCIFDGSALFVATFSLNIRPGGCEVFMFEQAADLPSATSSNNGGFRWDPSSLPRALIDLDEVVAQFGDDAIKVVASPSGDYVATYHVDNGQFDVTITARAADGYNISRVEFVDSTGHTTGAKACEWRKDGHDWYVSKLSRTIGAHVFTLNYAEFVPNAKIDEHLFELDSMGLNEGARIIDQRRGSDQLGAVTIFRYTKRETKQSADLVSAARAMPPKQPVRTIVVDHSAAMWRRIRLSGTILVVVGLAGAIIIRAIRRRNCGE